MAVAQPRDTAASTGKVTQVIGPVVDVEFSGERLPDIFDALEIDRAGQGPLVLEVQQNLGNGVVRTISMDATEGLQRGTAVRDTRAAIRAPVGRQTPGRLFHGIRRPPAR